MKPRFKIDRKILIPVIIFITIVVVVSIIYGILNSNQISNNNPGGTGGDFTPANTVIMTNSGVLYEYTGNNNATNILQDIKTSVIYNISISNNPNSNPDYIKTNSIDLTQQKRYKEGTSYQVAIDGDKINSTNGVPWNYWFTITTDDSRHFRIDINIDPSITSLISIKLLN